MQTLDSVTSPSCQMWLYRPLFCMLLESDQSLPWLGSSLQTYSTSQSAQSSFASVWPAAVLKPPRQTPCPPLLHAADMHRHIQICTNTHTHTQPSTY